MHYDVPLVTSETVIVMSEAIRCGSNITTRIISNDMLDFFLYLIKEYNHVIYHNMLECNRWSYFL